MPTDLSRANLNRFGPAVAVPCYDPAVLTAGIVHFGVGNFHRAHQAVYLDDLFNLGRDQDWALVGAGVRPADNDMRAALGAQDWLTTVVAQEAEASEARVTASMVEFVAPGHSAEIINRLADPAIRIVSLTITEGGYFIDPATQKFDRHHAEIAWDAQHFTTGPKTVFGLILAGLKRRRDIGIPPFTVMSCDNIPGNGHVTQNAVTGLADLIYPELGNWVERNVGFPNTMVDRITPATSDRERQVLEEQFGVRDRWPVFCEGFRQWVVEDTFTAGRPALEEVGVQFVSDVASFELMKIRILNGGHAAIAYPAGLLDIHFVHEAMQDDQIRAFLNKLERDEIIPIVPPVPNTDLADYHALIERRFANPKIGDTIRRLCLDGSNRQPKFILPSVRDRLAQGGSVDGLALVSALWCRYCYGETESGTPIAPNDPSWDRLVPLARAAREHPTAWLEMSDIFGDLSADPRYIGAFTKALTGLWSQGTRAMLANYLGAS
jgi:mannitol 2-dehydrogenase